MDAEPDTRLGIAGAGAMGAGIAALAVRCGIPTVLYDIGPAPLARGVERIERSQARAAERGDAAARPGWEALLTPTTSLAELGGCTLLLEAAPEDPEIKAQLLADLAVAAPAATLASNTSSIAISDLARRAGVEDRLVGLHFFNPPERMQLVELVSSGRAAEDHVQGARVLAERLGKHVIAVADGPGFLVNRCSRPYYLEALRIVEDGVASAAEVDSACAGDGGFPLGPFELMDLIGIDVNLAVTRSMYAQGDGEPRWRPSALQRSMVASGRLGRKSDGGFYGAGQSWRDQPESDPELRRTLLERVVSQLVNEAAFAVAEGVASWDQIDEGMVIGLRHPRGPGQWAQLLGPDRIVAILDQLWATQHDPRYRVAPELRRLAAAAKSG